MFFILICITFVGKLGYCFPFVTANIMKTFEIKKMIFIIKEGGHFLSKQGHKDLGKRPYLDFSILSVVFAVISSVEYSPICLI